VIIVESVHVSRVGRRSPPARLNAETVVAAGRTWGIIKEVIAGAVAPYFQRYCSYSTGRVGTSRSGLLDLIMNEFGLLTNLLLVATAAKEPTKTSTHHRSSSH
jgi:hypothetical protein